MEFNRENVDFDKLCGGPKMTRNNSRYKKKSDTNGGQDNGEG
jgi:hypothetical protein